MEKEPRIHKILFDIRVPIGVHLFQKFQKAVWFILPSRGRFEFIGRNMSSRFYFICRNDERLTVTLRSLLSSLLDHLVIRRRRRFLNILDVAQMMGRTLTWVVSKLNFLIHPNFLKNFTCTGFKVKFLPKSILKFPKFWVHRVVRGVDWKTGIRTAYSYSRGAGRSVLRRTVMT